MTLRVDAEVDTKKPQHIAIIMDGNRRWAQSRNYPREEGHREGYKTLKKIIKYCSDIGILYLTVYAFSTENWKRTEHEVSFLLRLMERIIVLDKEFYTQNNIRVLFIGDRETINQKTRRLITNIEKETNNNNGLTLCVAFNYGGRNEIVHAIGKIVESKSAVKDITEDLVSNSLFTAGIPDPDMVIRTGRNKRISNFLLWQISYSELYFTPILWPDFQEKDLDDAIEDYRKRKRNFGK